MSTLTLEDPIVNGPRFQLEVEGKEDLTLEEIDEITLKTMREAYRQAKQAWTDNATLSDPYKDKLGQKWCDVLINGKFRDRVFLGVIESKAVVKLLKLVDDSGKEVGVVPHNTVEHKDLSRLPVNTKK